VAAPQALMSMPDPASTHTLNAGQDISVTAPSSPRLPRTKRFLRSAARQQDIPLVLVLLILVGIVSVFHPDYLSEASLINIARTASFFAIMSIGTVFLLSMREIDLSVGSIYGLTIIIAGGLITHGVGPWVAAGIALLLSGVLGAINGVLTVLLKIQSLIVTLGTLSAYAALALIITNDTIITTLPISNSFFAVFGGNWLSIPISIWVAIFFGAVFHVVYRYTRFGFKVRAIGSNPEAARLGGISLNRAKIEGLVLQGLLCGISGVVTLAYIEAADPTSGTGYELQVIAAAIIGGTALSGGSGTVIGALIGALIISTISTGVVQFGLNADWGDFASGVLLIAAVALDAFLKRRRFAAAERVGVAAEHTGQSLPVATSPK
jgi:ribose transport system permease protein